MGPLVREEVVAKAAASPLPLPFEMKVVFSGKRLLSMYIAISDCLGPCP